MIVQLVFLSYSAGFQPPADAVECARIVLVDCSSSMAQEGRLETAKKEINSMAAALPPTPKRPVVVVPFTNAASTARTFTDLSPLTTFVGGLRADGGTRIAAALAAARAEAKKYAAVPLLVLMLYTDGEDQDQGAIAAEEAELDKVFAKRSKQGLKQSVVFCKRWENANDQLVTAFRRSGNADVTDAGSHAIVPVTLTPVFEVRSVQWKNTADLELDVELRGSVKSSPNASLANMPPLAAFLKRPVATGEARVELHAASPAALRFTTKVSDAELAAGRIELPFDVDLPKAFVDGKSKVLPSLAQATPTMVVQLPDLDGGLVTTPTPGRSRWLDPVARRMAVDVDLEYALTTKSGRPLTGPVTIKVSTKAGWDVTAGDTLVTTAQAGKHTSKVTLAGVVPESLTEAVAQLQVAASGTIRFRPPVLDIALRVPIPPPVTTKVGLGVRDADQPSWTDPARGIAKVVFRVAVRVDGPLPDGTPCTLQVGGATVRTQPTTLRSGEQVLVAEFSGKMLPDKKSTFDVSLAGVKTHNAVHVPPAAQSALVVEGPAALPIMLSSDGEPLELLPLSFWDADSIANVGVLATVQGEGPVPIPVELRAVSPLSVRPREIKLGVPAQVVVGLTHRPETPFWTDATVLCPLEVHPDASAVGIAAVQVPVEITLEAPFKKVLLWTALIGVPLVVVGLGIFCWLRFTSSLEEEEAPAK